jgi:hypothetical protein
MLRPCLVLLWVKGTHFSSPYHCVKRETEYRAGYVLLLDTLYFSYQCIERSLMEE